MMERKWWHDKVAYQIYPKSFLDTNGDGIGDLRGVISKLDYLKDLGVDIIWLSPIYKSPFVDQGYDISDYYAIAEEFGTMEEFDELLHEAKKRNMYILMDLVVNHCSSEHEWFKKALKDPEGEYADFFYFREGKDGNPPDNLRSYFGGSVWEPVPNSNKYYLHLFSKEQPDLNWENPKLREEVYKMVNWWLDKGLAGFRIDAIMNLKKDLEFPMYEPDGDDGLAICFRTIESLNEKNPEGIDLFLKELKERTFKPHDALTVAEAFNIDKSALSKFIGEDGYFSTIFDFSAETMVNGEHGWYDTPDFTVDEWKNELFSAQEMAEGIGFMANIIENHDEPRGVSRYLPTYAQNDMGKKMLATISLLFRGLPFIYQGQEIGMTNSLWNDVSEFDDINTKDQYKVARNAGLSEDEAMDACRKFSRDNARTPMQWTFKENAGFTEGTPWLKLNPNYVDINVESQEKDPDSVLNYYKKLIALRKAKKYSKTFVYGNFKRELEDESKIVAYSRSLNDQKIIIVANFDGVQREISIDESLKEILISNSNRDIDFDMAKDTGFQFVMEPSEVFVFEVEI